MKLLVLIQLLILLAFISCCPGKANRNNKENASVLTNPSELTETYWKLISINGKPLEGPADSTREAHLILHKNEKRAMGNGGCNRFSGTFNASDNKTIHFDELISTKMACMEVDYETAFLQALKQSDNYRISSDTLELLTADQVTAVFVAKIRL